MFQKLVNHNDDLCRLVKKDVEVDTQSPSTAITSLYATFRI